MNRDFVDLLHALSDAEARYLIVGAFALARLGRPRATSRTSKRSASSPADTPGRASRAPYARTSVNTGSSGGTRKRTGAT